MATVSVTPIYGEDDEDSEFLITYNNKKYKAIVFSEHAGDHVDKIYNTLEKPPKMFFNWPTKIEYYDWRKKIWVDVSDDIFPYAGPFFDFYGIKEYTWDLFIPMYSVSLIRITYSKKPDRLITSMDNLRLAF